MGEHCHYPQPGWIAARLNINTWRHSMARVHIMGGYLNVEGMSGGYPGNELPGDQPGIDNSLPGMQPGVDNSLPKPPPGVWPPPVPTHPIVPVPPGSTAPPGTIWPSPGHPAHPIAPGGAPPTATHPIAPGGSPPRPDQTLPPTGMDPHPSHPIASGTYWCLVYLPGFGWKYVVIDPSLEINAEPPAPQPVPTPHK